MEHGLASLSLRPLASALDTSTYTLTYQFGSKREIVEAIMISLTEADAASAWGAGALSPGQRAKAIWSEASDPEHVGHNRLLNEQVTVGSLEELEEHAAHRLRARRTALEASLVSAGVAAEDAVTGATVVCAMIDGLILDLLATGDAERLDRAMAWLVDWLDDAAF
jgi:AcrR family transcriptional regulator